MVVTPNSISLSCEVFMRQRWMIRLAFGYLLMGENRAARPPQPKSLVCMPFSGIRGPIGEEECGEALAVAARFAERSPSVSGLRVGGSLKSWDAYGRDCGRKDHELAPMH
jgi:hypothetical protein